MLPGDPGELAQRIPVGWLGKAEEVADLAVAMLANPYLTNQVISLDGGMYPADTRSTSLARPRRLRRLRANLRVVYHFELRQFPHVARAFNLTREELERRILAAWSAGRAVECDDRRFSPDRSRLQVYEGPRLRPDQIGMGRGWANATRAGADVTEQVLAEARDISRASDDRRRRGIDALKREIVTRCAAGGFDVREAVWLASDSHPAWRASDRLALAERSVWELLHEGRVRLVARLADPSPGAVEVVAKPRWEAALLAWETWAPSGAARVLLEAERTGGPAPERLA